jgi:sensor histidine kinase regulating citrate/malate metabolism
VSLRARLTLFFIVIVVMPLTAVTAYGWSAVARTTQRQVRSKLELACASAQVAFENRLERARDAVASWPETGRVESCV